MSKKKFMSAIMALVSSLTFSSEEDLFKKLEKEVVTTSLHGQGIEYYQKFMHQMQTIDPDEQGNRDLGYTVQKTKKNITRLVIGDVEHVVKYDDSFEVFKGFRVTELGAVSISRDLDTEKFDALSPAMKFFSCIVNTFDSPVGRIQIPLQQDDAVVTFWQSRSKRTILGCVQDENGLPKRLEK